MRFIQSLRTYIIPSVAHFGIARFSAILRQLLRVTSFIFLIRIKRESAGIGGVRGRNLVVLPQGDDAKFLEYPAQSTSQALQMPAPSQGGAYATVSLDWRWGTSDSVSAFRLSFLSSSRQTPLPLPSVICCVSSRELCRSWIFPREPDKCQVLFQGLGIQWQAR